MGLTILIFVFNAVALLETQNTKVFMSKVEMAVHLAQRVCGDFTELTQIDFLCSGLPQLFLLPLTKVCGLDVDVLVPSSGECLVTTRECTGVCFVFRMAPNVTFENVYPGERLITPNYGTFERPGLQVIKHVARPL